MTTIFSHQGVMYADMLHVRLLPVSRLTLAPKIRVSKSGMLAYGTTGRVVKDERLDLFESVLHRFFDRGLKGSGILSSVVPLEFTKDKEFKDLLETGCQGFIAMDSAGMTMWYPLVASMHMVGRFTMVEAEIPSSIGSVAPTVPGMLLAGIPPSEVFEICRREDACTGSRYTSRIEAASLKPFKWTEEEKTEK